MSFFLLPEIHDNIDLNIIYDETPNIYVSLTLNKYLNEIKKQIDENCDTWDFVKKYTNPYEFIHTIIPNFKTSISTLKPLSRSFYKMIEISNILHIFEDFKNINIKTFHLAEGPGGFIEATTYLRQNYYDTYFGMTLLNNDDPNVPGWNKSKLFFEKNENVIIETGATGNGDLLDVNNLIHCKAKYKGKIEIITADGGFDFSVDFNKQESLATNLLFAQVSFAITMQKEQGHFILKVFDIFTKTSCDILYLLSCLYKQVFIMKPNTSRLANSEKYIVCKYFKGVDDNLLDNIIKNYDKINCGLPITSLFNTEINYYYMNKIEEYNAIFGQQQIENIFLTLNLILCKSKSEKLESFKKNNIYKCIQWCEKNNIPFNKLLTNNNIFTS